MWSTLFVAMALSCQTAKQPELTLGDLDRLVALYTKVQLPFPPIGAPLVSTQPIGTVGNQKVTSVGYLIESSGQKSMLMLGTIPSQLYGDFQTVQIEASIAKKILLKTFGTSLPFDEDWGMALAVIERTRGHDKFALALLKEAARNLFERRFVPMNPSSMAELEARIQDLAVQHWMNSIVALGTDRVEIHRQLTLLVKEYPSLLDEELKEVITGLEAHTREAIQATNEIDALIESLTEVQEDGTQLESPDPSRRPRFVPLLSIVGYGYDAIPNLIAHFNDKRFSRAVWPGRMNAPTRLISVSEVCTNIAEQFCTEKSTDWQLEARQQTFLKWWAANSSKDHRESCRELLLRPTNFYHPEAPVRWAPHTSA